MKICGKNLNINFIWSHIYIYIQIYMYINTYIYTYTFVLEYIEYIMYWVSNLCYIFYIQYISEYALLHSTLYYVYQNMLYSRNNFMLFIYIYIYIYIYTLIYLYRDSKQLYTEINHSESDHPLVNYTKEVHWCEKYSKREK